MITYEVKGLDALIKKVSPEILKQPMRDFFNKATIVIQNRARTNAPVDTGTLRNSIQQQVDPSDVPMWGKAGLLGASEGSHLWVYGRAMEYGTGRVGDPAVSHLGEHFPPGAALETWAGRHGFASGWQVAAAIAKRGGLLPRKFLRNALADSVSDIKRFISELGVDIKGRWDGK